MGCLLDASVLIALMMAERHTPAVRAKMLSHSGMFVSTFVTGEVASAYSRRVRMSELTEREAMAGLSAFDAWRENAAQLIEVDPGDIRRAVTIVRRFELMLKMPDALHLAMAERRSLELFTADDRLAAAADRLSVRCWAPSRPA